MGEKLESNLFKSSIQLLLILSVAGAVLLPPIHISSGLPAFEVSDLTMPIIGLSILIVSKVQLADFLKTHRKLIGFFSFFMIVMIISIFWNKRWFEVRDWFEVLKAIKFILFIVAFYLFFTMRMIIKTITVLFLIVFAFNLLHYFDVFNFNSTVEVFYAPPHHLDYFGLNSIGEPSTKRALGTLGNPNNNAILFLVFLVFFLPKRESTSLYGLLLFLLAISSIFLCQSRTGFLTYIILLLTYFFTARIHWKKIAVIILISIAYFVVSNLSGNVYMESMSDAEVMKAAGEGRFAQWMKILNSMPGHWLFGHAPNKLFFETNEIYSESEYFLMLFRYGVVGTLAFVSFWVVWFIKYALPLSNRYNIALFVLIIYTIPAITNNPMQSPKIALVLGLLMAYTLLNFNEQRQEYTNHRS